MLYSVIFLMALNLLISIFLPFFPVDETRYLSVAWSMHINHNWLIQTLSGLPYFHKPPFMFWLINSLWQIFSPDFKWIRVIPLIFSVLSLFLYEKIYFLLYENSEKKWLANSIFILSTTIGWISFSWLIMFDIVLTFFTLWLCYLLVSSIKENRPLNWPMITIIFTLALLTKGPVFFVHSLPAICLLGFRFKRRDWLRPTILAIFIGCTIGLIWLYLANKEMGGGRSISQILLHQSIDRLSHPYAHKNSVLYLIATYILFFIPWVFSRSFWSGLYLGIKNNQFLWPFLFPPLIFFFLIPTRQPHYLLPELPYLIMLITAPKTRLFISEKKQVFIYLAYILLFLTVLLTFHKQINQYDTSKISTYIARCLENNIPVIVASKYFGEFDYTGHLPKQLTLCSSQECRQWAKDHPNGLIIINTKDPRTIKKFLPCAVKTFNYKTNRKILIVQSNCY